jgi:hypothetical protein
MLRVIGVNKGVNNCLAQGDHRKFPDFVVSEVFDPESAPSIALRKVQSLLNCQGGIVGDVFGVNDYASVRSLKTPSSQKGLGKMLQAVHSK